MVVKQSTDSDDVQDDVEDIVKTAAFLHVSEFEVFQLAYRNWFGHTAANREIDAFFSRYMSTAAAPIWVRAFTRRIRQLHREGRLNLREFGIQSPAPATHQSAIQGVIALVLMILIVILLVYLANRAEDTLMAGCQLPPCY
jgi:hypothetical protein